jgi:hypothetical protein
MTRERRNKQVSHTPSSSLYLESLLQDPNAAGVSSFGPGSNSAFALGGHQSTYSGSQMNANMLGSFPQQQPFVHQSIMDDNSNLFATLQNQHQLLPQAIQGMMGGNSLQHFANSSSLGGGGMNMGGMFSALNSGNNINFPTMSMAGEANLLNGAQLENTFLSGNSNPSFFLQQQQQQQLQFEQQQQLLLQQQQLQQQIQQNQLQLQQFQRQTMHFPEPQSQMQSPFLSNANSPLSRPLPDLGKLDDTNTLQYRDDESDKAPKRPTRRPANNTSQSSKTKSFPEKLMSAMLENRNEDVVGWLPDGKSFVIVSPEKFMNQVLGKEAKNTTKYSSFVRKLHRLVVTGTKLVARLYTAHSTHWCTLQVGICSSYFWHGDRLFLSSTFSEESPRFGF